LFAAIVVEETLRISLELFEAALSAEVVSLTAMLHVPDRVGRIDRHPAHRVDDLSMIQRLVLC
jgi:hypothetical protein